MFDEVAHQRERDAALQRLWVVSARVETLLERTDALRREAHWWRQLAITSALLSAGTFGLVSYHLW